MSLFSTIKSGILKIANITRPFFDKISRKKKFAIFSSYVGIHFLEFYITKCFAESAVKSDENNNMLGRISFALGNLLVMWALNKARGSISFYLSNSLEASLKDEIETELLNNKTIIGISFIQELEANSKIKSEFEKLQLNTLLGHTENFANGVISLSLSTTSGVASLIINLHHMRTLINNERLILTFPIYGLLIYFIGFKLNGSRFILQREMTKQDDKIVSSVTNLLNNKEQIVCLGGQKLELERIKTQLSAKSKSSEYAFRMNLYYQGFFTSAFQTVVPTLQLLGPILIKDALIKPDLIIFFIQQARNFTNHLQELADIIYQGSSSLKIGLDKIDHFKSLVEKWNKFNQHRFLEHNYLEQSQSKPGIFFLKNLNIHIPEKGNVIEQAQQILRKSNLVQNTNFEFSQGNTYHLTGNSGSGKTTTLKAILGYFPLCSGRIIYPCKQEEIHFIPQKTFIPTDASLLEVIIYPKKTVTESEITRIKEYMKRLNLGKLIQSITNKEDWDNKLSRGEIQRLAIIGALIKKPKLLIMDEATASIDKKTKVEIESMIKKILNDTTIIFTDHNPSDKGFTDHTIHIDKKRKTLKIV